ncbi:hypothetical protein WHR41_06528 [Cladosporium halotolerans]|uniref:SAC3/GANP/THP3 conserved domain-containing protein n=1 Tax=Cladosporium halotolerans TaxID=1052096 RepID=A0AB34KPB0_9PEZI
MAYSMQPAFTPVQARQTLQKPNPSQNQAQPSAQKTSWGQNVRDWVQRAFAEENAIHGIPETEWREYLLTFLPKLQAAGQLDTIDWSTYPTPQELIVAERQQAAYAQSVPNTNMNGYSPFSLSIDGSKKRKSGDLEVPDREPVTPPWKKNKRGLEDRITSKSKTQEKKQKKAKAFQDDLAHHQSNDALERRRQRFGHVSPVSSPMRSRDDTPSTENPTGPVVGTCQRLEKNYFRLTSAPKPEEVRPVPVLEEMFTLLRKKWKTEHKYSYACDQFKSLRQDLTVQHVKTDFTVRVYEAHARIALEIGDLEKRMESVAHALQVRAALASGNFVKFFRLFQATPYLGAYLLDMIVPRERLAALSTICRSYKPDISLDFVVNSLAFHGEDDDSDAAYRNCIQFICDHGGEHLIERKDDGRVRLLTGKAGNTFETAKKAAFRTVDIKGQK